MGADGAIYDSPTPGLLGGNGRDRIYGRLDCPAALSGLRWALRPSAAAAAGPRRT